MKKKKNSSRKFLVLILSFTMILGLIPSVSFAGEQEGDSPKGYITLSIEKFVLGKGFLREPEQVAYYEGDTVGNIIYRTLGADNIKGTISNGNISYLSGIRDSDNSEVNLPESLKGTTLTVKKDADWLQQMDYSSGAGWMYSVNNVSPNVGLSSYLAKDGDVVRLHFVLNYANQSANADALLEKIAIINSSEDKSKLLSDAKIKSAYDNANKVAADFDATEDEINAAYKLLVDALPKGDTYTLTYKGNGATGQVTDEGRYGKNDLTTIASSDELYCPDEKYFSCWNTAADGSGTSYQPGDKIRFSDKNITLYAIWDNEYQVTYDVNVANGGGTTAAPTDTATYFPGRTVTLKTISTWSQKPDSGLTFNGWNTKADGTGDSYAGAGKMVMPKGNVTLYAMWSKGYNVTYDLNEGTGSKPSDTTLYAEGSTVTAKSCSAKKVNQKFASWNTKADGTGETFKYNDTFKMKENGMTLYAQYQEAYTITYNANSGTGTAPSNGSLFLEGETCTAYSGSNLSKGGTMAFKEWNTEADGTGTVYPYGATITFDKENIVLYAQYETGYHILYNLNGGTGTTPMDTTIYSSRGSAYLKSGTSGIIAPAGKKFYSWNTSADGTGTSYTSGSIAFNGADIKLYAIYGPELKVYRVDNEGDTPVQVGTTTYAKGGTAYISSVKPTNPPQDKIFLGWTTDVNTTTTVTSVKFDEADIIIYAVYSNGLSLKYDINGGSGTAPTDSNKYGGSTYATLADGSVITPPEGKNFIRWNTEADGTGTSYNSKQSYVNVNPYITQGLEELTLYAIYDTPYTVSYDTKGGSAVTDAKQYYDGNSVTISSSIPTKEDNTFVRWNTKKDGTGKDYKPGEKMAIKGQDIVLYARWAKNAIFYDNNGEDVPVPTDSNLYSVSASVTTMKPSLTLAPSGKRFVEWNTKADGSGTSISAGKDFTMPKADATLYAIWGNWDEVIDRGITAGVNHDEQNTTYSYGNEWPIFAMLRSDGKISAANKEQYFKSVAKKVKNNSSFRKNPANVAETILGLQACGIDAGNVEGTNLLAMLYDYDDSLGTKGAEDVALALVALDSNKTDIPETSNWSRDKLVEAILKHQSTNGGFAQTMTSGNGADVNVTAKCLTALAPYANNAKVKEAIDAGIQYLRDSMDENANFGNSSNVAQVITALSANRIDFMKKSNGFTVGNNNLLQTLDSYRVGTSGFKALGKDTNANGSATQQALYALESYKRLLNGEKRVFDLTDVKITEHVTTQVDKPDTDDPDKDPNIDNPDKDPVVDNPIQDSKKDHSAKVSEKIKGGNEDTDKVQTGDNTSLILWVMMLLMSAVGAIAVEYRRKRQ